MQLTKAQLRSELVRYDYHARKNFQEGTITREFAEGQIALLNVLSFKFELDPPRFISDAAYQPSLLEREKMFDKVNDDVLVKLHMLHKAFNKYDFELRLVGGAVRDLLMGKTPKDFDLATDATPEEMLEIATKEDMHVIPTGIKHGTLSFVVDRYLFEVTTLRIDSDCDGRHCDVKYTTSFEQDALRRDFTINAMNLDFDGYLSDYFGGQNDIENHVIRFVGNPTDRIKEDYLRVFRFFRFMSKFDDNATLDTNALNLMSEDWVKEGIKTISVERIWSELKKMLESDCCFQQFELMANAGILALIGIDWLDFNTGYDKRNFLRPSRSTISPMAKLAILFNSKSKVSAEQFGRNMKMSLAEINELTFISDILDVGHVFDVYDLKRLIANNQPRAWVHDIASILGMLDEIKGFNPCKFPILGRDLVALGVSPGPGLGDILGKLHTLWVDRIIDGISLSKEDLLNMLHPIPGSSVLYPLPTKEI